MLTLPLLRSLPLLTSVYFFSSRLRSPPLCRTWHERHLAWRSKAGKLTSAVRTWQHSSLARCWQAWAAYAQERRAGKAALSAVMGERRQAVCCALMRPP